ncbi:MFS transporter [Burkholderia lata]|uniref:MFS transporter n=1 Tax=Burkholderia lata (strain ATCC 17760 / DSM 23089 / LMG 22485 / NCIMB 9086 / R18194 / 383) TaxID=482957 RepID=UPI001453BB0E|nr:MFS transporter [Burkholderia lata]VWC78763.1 MFS transporter [Burkholderia lata]
MNTSADQLPSSLGAATFVPFLLASIALAAAYGASFLLSEHLRQSGLNPSMAGAVISTGILTMIVSSVVAGWVAQRIGLMSTIVAAAAVMALSMLAFSLAAHDMRIAFIGGLLLGMGWSAFYILAPLQIIHHLRPSARIKYLTLLSGGQMVGLGLASPAGHFIASRFGSYAIVYAGLACLCVIAAVAFSVVRKRAERIPHPQADATGLTVARVAEILRHVTRLPIIMIGLAACTFSALSNFQTIYAESRHLSPDLFFVTFTLTTVFCRFTLAQTISRLPVRKLAFTLFAMTLLALVLFVSNPGSEILYVIGSFVFAIGYGLSYSTLNGMAVNLANEKGLSASASSQVFTIAYFTGLFGFPYIAGVLVTHGGVNGMIVVTIAVVVVNLLMLTHTSLRRENAQIAAR